VRSGGRKRLCCVQKVKSWQNELRWNASGVCVYLNDVPHSMCVAKKFRVVCPSAEGPGNAAVGAAVGAAAAAAGGEGEGEDPAWAQEDEGGMMLGREEKKNEEKVGREGFCGMVSERRE